ncbi:MAG TPA: signal peptidase II [Stellaceae bacterium]|nr:signal peptidase II [Stellaceae bacterium]
MMLRRGLAVAVVVAVADQLSKAWLLGFFAERQPVERMQPVTGFFNLVLTWNRGMSFGLFNNDATLNAAIFTVIAAVIVGGLLVWLRRAQEPLIGIAIGLVIGGAIGNVVDRLWRGAVVDFLDFHLGDWHWFAFNLADAAICIGVGLMVIDSLLGRREAPN